MVHPLRRKRSRCLGGQCCCLSIQIQGHVNIGKVEIGGGHVPGARSVLWKTAANDDGTFKTRAELEQIYQENLGYKPEDDTIVYCRIGERSSHTWFVLTKLLGFEKVRNYDGSWTEWGNMVRTPVEKG